jgi:hypothetical protein
MSQPDLADAQHISVHRVKRERPGMHTHVNAEASIYNLKTHRGLHVNVMNRLDPPKQRGIAMPSMNFECM